MRSTSAIKLVLSLSLVVFLAVYYSHHSGSLTLPRIPIPKDSIPFLSVLDDTKITRPEPQAEPEGDLTIELIHTPLPRRNFSDYAAYPPQHINDTSGFAFATMLCTPNPDANDPFFAATQQVVWRILWSGWHSRHPMIVYVCPSTPDYQRTILAGQGVIITEIELISDVLDVSQLHLNRWKDQLAKLNMWKSTEFKRIAFLDCDAFPLSNIDDIFLIVPEQECLVESLSQEDKELHDGPGGAEFCRYTFGGAEMSETDRELNGGVFVFSPNLLMHRKLTRDVTKTREYDSRTAEQGLLNSNLGFGLLSPFPRTTLSQRYNADKEAYLARQSGVDVNNAVKILHCKLWNPLALLWAPELNKEWDHAWMEMSRFYDGDVFPHARRTGRRKEWLELIGEQQANGKKVENFP